MKKLIMAAVLSAHFFAAAGDNVPGNCGQGSGASNACTSSQAPGASASSTNLNTVTVRTEGVAGGAGGAGGQASVSTGPQVMDGSNNASQAVNVGGGTYMRAASTAIAPAIPPTALCATSRSAGIQGLSFGLAVGRSFIDDNCATIEAAKAVHALGRSEVAHEVLCELPKIRDARRRAGDPCAVDR